MVNYYVINSAKSSSGHKGEQISSVEKDIFAAFEALENKIHKIKLQLKIVNATSFSNNTSINFNCFILVKSDRFKEPTKQIVKVFFLLNSNYYSSLFFKHVSK